MEEEQIGEFNKIERRRRVNVEEKTYLELVTEGSIPLSED